MNQSLMHELGNQSLANGFNELFIGTVRRHVYAIIVCSIALFISLHVNEISRRGACGTNDSFILCANQCGCWCIPITLPQSLHHPLHVIDAIRKYFYLSQHVVVNAYTTLRAVVHGQRCCFHMFQ